MTPHQTNQSFLETVWNLGCWLRDTGLVLVIRKRRFEGMNWDQSEGKWKQVKGNVKQTWGKITDDDLDYIAGKRENLVGKLQERYGMAKEEAQKKADDWS